MSLWFALTAAACAQAPPLSFEIRSTPEIHQKPFTGRICIFFANLDTSSGRGRRPPEPRLQQDWFSPLPMIAWDVENWQPQNPARIAWGDPRLKVFPPNLKPEALSQWQAQAVVRFNPLDPEVATGVGNGISQAARVQPGQPVTLQVSQLLPEPPFTETSNRKLLQVTSPLLSRFHGRDVRLQASVHLPASYAASSQRYPVILEIPGFGGDHRRGMYQQPNGVQTTEFIRVVLDPRCPLGHHVFANSENNGPWGDALVQEFLPELDRSFRTVGTPASRFLCGHSSGGWSSLWLMVNYPDTFAGTWSTSPDPVDFRDFQQINVYRDRSMFTDATGRVRPLARSGGRVLVSYEDFSRMEDVLGPGGQLLSFEAVFSRRSGNGAPQLLWNRQTGEIDHAVAETWKKYDIRLLLEQNWPQLGPKLAGKVHIFMGTEDTFYLNGATALLKESLAKLGSDAQVELLPGRDHSTIFQGGLRSRIEQAMAQQYEATRKSP